MLSRCDQIQERNSIYVAIKLYYAYVKYAKCEYVETCIKISFNQMIV